MTGTVKLIKRDRGFLFITATMQDPQSGLLQQVDYFAHRNTLHRVTFERLVEGDALDFTPVQSPYGLRAEDVRLPGELPTAQSTVDL